MIEARHIMWSPWTGPGLEQLRLSSSQKGIVADSVILGVDEQGPFRIHYAIYCDAHWRLRAVHLDALDNTAQSLHLFTDGAGAWTTERGEAIPLLKGCLDVDITATPFTNTLPIRRLALQLGFSTALRMVYISVPQMQVEVTDQRYSCLELTAAGGRYRYESIENGESVFAAELSVDEDGVVLDYLGLFKRVR